jgi:hypothetical protein
MVPRRKTSLLEWLFCGAFFIVGCGFLGLHVFHRLYGTTPEDDLTLAEGVVHDVTLSHGRYASYLKFTVAGYRTEYSSDHPKFKEVLFAAQSGAPVQIWVSTKQETLFPRQGWVPLYKLSAGGIPVLTYFDVVSHTRSQDGRFLFFCLVVLGIGIYGLFTVF